jgi:hypothetical protein
MKIHTQKMTTAAALAPPSIAISNLVKIALDGSGNAVGAPGDFLLTGSQTLNGAVAHFPAFPGLQVAAAVGAAEYPQITNWYPLWAIKGTNINVGNVTVTNITQEYLTYSDATSLPGFSAITREIGQFRAVAVSSTETTSSSQTYTLDVQSGQLKPKYLIAAFGVQVGTITAVPAASISMPATDVATQAVAAIFAPGALGFADPFGVGEPTSDTYTPAPSYTLTHTADVLGGATSLRVRGYLYY